MNQVIIVWNNANHGQATTDRLTTTN